MFNASAKAKRDTYHQIVKLLPQEEGITWQEVRDFLYMPLVQMGKLDELLNRDTPAQIIIDIIQDLMKSEYAQRLHEQRVIKEKVKIHNPSTKRGKDFEVLQTPSEKIKVAFWFIDKCGGPEEAAKALEAASFAIKKFEKS